MALAMKSIGVLTALAASMTFASTSHPKPADLSGIFDPFLQSVFSKHRPVGEYRISVKDQSNYSAVTIPKQAIHIPTKVNEDAGYLLYQNIRYAEPPVGELRFDIPTALYPVDGALPVLADSEPRSCYQAIPDWLDNTLNTLKVPGQPPFDWEEAFRTSTDSEDCLFLDIATPLGFDENERLPVMVWIFGGGYVYGAKDMPIYSPAGFYKRACEADEWPSKRFIFVTINYRLGAFGWLSGPKFESQGGHPNIGLYDQRLALEWIQTNIHSFGGDPHKITVMGESAGAGSIAHHIVWNEREDPAGYTPFKKAIMQSPAWVPIPDGNYDNGRQDQKYEEFLGYLQVSHLKDAWEAQTKDLVAANRKLIANSAFGTFTTGPVIDSRAITDYPNILFSQGKQNRSIEIFAGSVEAEGLPFVPLKTLLDYPNYNPDWTDDQVLDYIHNALPLLEDATAHEILEAYPLDDDKYNKFGISKQSRRLFDIAGQALVQCNARIFADRGSRTSEHSTFGYSFKGARDGFTPIFHGQDVPYTFFDQPNSKINENIAVEWQKYLLGFVIDSDPNLLKPVTKFENYYDNSAYGEVLELDVTGGGITGMIDDPFSTDLCDEFWPLIWRIYNSEGKPINHVEGNDELK